jgi:ubiquinone/menaquinone biosynthesis C-methylase UbiE
MTDVRLYYQTRYRPDARRAATWRAVAGYLASWIPPEGRVLELAAGFCDFSNNVTARQRVAMDLNPDLPRFASEGVEAEVGDSTDLSRFASHAFDVVFASNFLEHLEWPQVDACIAEVKRVLVPSGRLLLMQPNFRLRPGEYFDDYTHRTVFSDRSLKDYLEARGLVCEHVEPRFLPQSMKSRLAGLHRLVPLYLRLPYRPLAGQMLVVARTRPNL